jgi:hypothetical protein
MLQLHQTLDQVPTLNHGGLSSIGHTDLMFHSPRMRDTSSAEQGPWCNIYRSNSRPTQTPSYSPFLGLLVITTPQPGGGLWGGGSSTAATLVKYGNANIVGP